MFPHTGLSHLLPPEIGCLRCWQHCVLNLCGQSQPEQHTDASLREGEMNAWVPEMKRVFCPRGKMRQSQSSPCGLGWAGGPGPGFSAPAQGQGGQPGQRARREHYLVEETRRLPTGRRGQDRGVLTQVSVEKRRKASSEESDDKPEGL